MYVRIVTILFNAKLFLYEIKDSQVLFLCKMKLKIVRILT